MYCGSCCVISNCLLKYPTIGYITFVSKNRSLCILTAYVVGLASMSDVAERFLVYSPEIFRLMAARLVRSIGGIIHMSVRQCFSSGFRPSGMKRLAHCHREGLFFGCMFPCLPV